MSTPTSIIINTDPGIDDVLAITMALSHPDRVKIEAICLTFGNTTVQNGRDNIIRLFCVLQQHIAENPYEEGRIKFAKTIKKDFMNEKEKKLNQIILAKGASVPLKGSQFDASHFHGQDGLSDISTLPGNPWPLAIQIPNPLCETKKHAYEVILDILRKNPINTVRIVSLGPLTNLALAWLKDPATFSRIGGISMMGCALDVPGNDTPCAEYNAFADPYAIRILLQDAPQHPILRSVGKRLPFDVLPLDITKEYKIPFAQLCGDGITDKGILQKFYAAILARPRQIANSHSPDHLEALDKEKYDNFQAHDPLAMAHAIFCPSAVERQQTLSDPINGTFADWAIRTRTFGMETDGYLTRGQCVIDRRVNSKDNSFVISTKKIRRRSIQVISKVDPNSSVDFPALSSSSSSSCNNRATTEIGLSHLRERFSPSSFPQGLRTIKSFMKLKQHASTTPSSPMNEVPRQVIQEEKEEQLRPLKGSWDVVVSSPGLDWFREEFLASLNLS